ncbi:3'(2'),5'-bisphosphate nucleotidase [Anaerolineae bacterium CFX8]|nr:3'(2'),5'-bisphosphate nucleotidase [Anaerolineae bacterium CFX8]
MIDFQPIFQAVRQAAELCRAVQEMHLAGGEKGGHEPVTVADYGAQALLCRAISLHFPDDAVLAEEQGGQFVELVSDGEKAQVIRLLSETLGQRVTEADIVRWLDHGYGGEAERTWVIDPIDGTRGFLALRNYVIAAGLLVDKRPAGAVIGAPGYPTPDRRGVLFHAQSGIAYMQPLYGGALKRIRASDRAEPASLRVLESVEKSHASHERMERVRRAAGLEESALERLDSMEKYARIAAGDAELYLRLPRLFSKRPHMVWDHAAGVALVQAAGGLATDVDGSPLDFTQGRTLANNRGIIVSNGRIHARVLEGVAKVLAEESQA